MNFHGLFATPVGFGENYELTEDELAFITEQETRSNMGNTTSVNNKLLSHVSMGKLCDHIQAQIDAYFAATFNPKYKVKLKITQSWANYTKENQWHHKHAHPNSLVSGVFYVKADKEKDKIFFYRDGYQQIKMPPKEWNAWNSESWWFSVGTGEIILFPSGLTHMVETVKGEDRISISFNTFPKGYIGEDLDLTGLHL